MPTLVLCLAILILNGYLFYAPIPPGWVPALEVVVLLLLGILFLTLSLRTLRRSAERLAERPLVVPVDLPAETEKPTSAAADGGESSVVQFLARLQEKGRLVDFLLEDIAPYGNEQVGSAARVVHQGCREVLSETFDLQPVHTGSEGEAIVLGGDYDAGRYRLIGKVPDRAPFRGTVRHRGWRTARVNLPKVAGSGEAVREVVAPAEVEIV